MLPNARRKAISDAGDAHRGFEAGPLPYGRGSVTGAVLGNASWSATWVGAWAVLLLFGAVGRAAASEADAAQVTITGGADVSGRTYTWTVRHSHGAPLTAVEIPQHYASWQLPPAGWRGTIVHGRDTETGVGLVRFEAASLEAGLVRGASAEFRLGVGTQGTPRGKGTAMLHFADGLRLSVAVEVPIVEPLSDRNVPLIGLGVLFVLFIAGRHWARRRKAAGEDVPPPYVIG